MKTRPTIYKVRALVNYTKRGGDIERAWYKERIFVGHLKQAKLAYHSLENAVRSEMCYANYSGVAELFVPHVFDDGELAYWPDGDNYICRYDSEHPEG